MISNFCVIQLSQSLQNLGKHSYLVKEYFLYSVDFEWGLVVDCEYRLVCGYIVQSNMRGFCEG